MIGRHDGFPHSADNVYINASGQKPEFANREEAPIATLVLIPGLVSDAIVWQPLEAAVAGRMPGIFNEEGCVIQFYLTDDLDGQLIDENAGFLPAICDQVGQRFRILAILAAAVCKCCRDQ